MEHVLLIESDPFVRIDMEQALQSGFPKADIRSYATLEEADHAAAPSLMLIDIPAAELSEKLAARGWELGDVICVLTGASGQNAAGRFTCLSRPFTDDMLLSTVRAALKPLIVGC